MPSKKKVTSKTKPKKVATTPRRRTSTVEIPTKSKLKDAFLVQLAANMGNVSEACKAVGLDGVNRQMYNKWLREDKKFRDNVDNYFLGMRDKVGTRLYSEAIQGNLGAIAMFYKEMDKRLSPLNRMSSVMIERALRMEQDMMSNKDYEVSLAKEKKQIYVQYKMLLAAALEKNDIEMAAGIQKDMVALLQMKDVDISADVSQETITAVNIQDLLKEIGVPSLIGNKEKEQQYLDEKFAPEDKDELFKDIFPTDKDATKQLTRPKDDQPDSNG